VHVNQSRRASNRTSPRDVVLHPPGARRTRTPGRARRPAASVLCARGVSHRRARCEGTPGCPFSLPAGT
jgi:hypothetical protein